ncbi:receptor-like protein EIX1 [Cryptomeria japonica]|uniref:receptor-like protein EIX1 n=1 Tax=Cryptomeria japonica TaxID=3369 RepID=UPI0027DA87EA|nr:receptor-like protein EIX1 [Cryptomeria japonica]
MSPISFYIALSLALGIAMVIDFPYASGCRGDERSYLLDFKGGLNDSCARLSSWQGYNCCEWQGIVCDYGTNHVIQLDLKNPYHEGDEHGYQINCELRGKIHPALFNLQYVEHLDLSWNDFEGIAIPSQLGRLRRLTFLNLAYARFEGEVPLELGNLSALQHLDLSDYYLYFSEDSDNPNWRLKSSRFDQWIRSLRNLEYLAMKKVNLEKESHNWGASLSSLPNLNQIYLSHCGLSGNIPSLLNLTHLSHLHLRGNSFPFPVPAWFQNVSSFVCLDLCGCGLSGSIPSEFLQNSLSLTNLRLATNSLGGVTPTSIANFSKLKTLVVFGNYLEGDMPPFGSPLGPPSSFLRIDLSGNNLKGGIPDCLGRLSSLQYLFLYDNQLNGYIPASLGQLSVLRQLELDNNQLSGGILNSFAELTALEVLSLSSNNLTGCISISMFQNLTKLRILLLSRNRMTINISSSRVPQFSHLQHLGLSSCNIGESFQAFLSSQYSLETLDLSDNIIRGDVPTWLRDLPSLYMLNLSNNQLEGLLPPLNYSNFKVVDLHNNSFHGPISALSFDGLQLDLSHNKFNGSIPDKIIALLYLSLSANNLSGGVPHSMCRVENDLKILDLSDNRLKDVIPADLGRCSSLKIFNLAQNDLYGEMPEQMGNLNQLETLNLNGNNLHGIIPSSIANCTNIQVFDIGNNRFKGTIPFWIGKMRDLQILSLTNNKLEGSIPAQLFELQNLQILDLSHNNISGAIPKSLEMLHAMINQSQSFETRSLKGSLGLWTGADTYIYDGVLFVDQITLWIKGTPRPYPKIWSSFKVMDLSHNKLSGSIPQAMGLLQGLVALNISNNNISGSIPESMGQMVNLQSLDLSINMLSGKIPQELVSLTFLSVLNLSENMLSGLIPQGNQFSTFEASSFLGNPKLRGPPLENRKQSSGFGERGSQVKPNRTVVANADKMDRWWAVSVGLCFGVGFATVIAVLCFHVEWSYICFSWLDGLVVYLCER